MKKLSETNKRIRVIELSGNTDETRQKAKRNGEEEVVTNIFR